MIARAAVLFLTFSGFIYAGLWFLATSRMTKEGAKKFLKIAGLVLISGCMASVALLFIMLADKLS